MSEKSAALAEHLQQPYLGPLTSQHIEFLRDAASFIDYGIRNGLNFCTIVATIGQDFNNVLREGFDLAAVKANGYVPKVSAYAKLTDAGVGESEELDD